MRFRIETTSGASYRIDDIDRFIKLFQEDYDRYVNEEGLEDEELDENDLEHFISEVVNSFGVDIMGIDDEDREELIDIDVRVIK